MKLYILNEAAVWDRSLIELQKSEKWEKMHMIHLRKRQVKAYDEKKTIYTVSSWRVNKERNVKWKIDWIFPKE